MSAGTIEDDDDKLEQAVANMALTSLRRLVGSKQSLRRAQAVRLTGAYGVANTVSLYVEHGQETFHAIRVEVSSSFSLALRISLLAAALLAALV